MNEEHLQALEDYTVQGAEVLDKYYPQWTSVIDTSRLNMMASNTCIAGQLGQEFGETYDDIVDRLQENTGLYAVDLGFDISDNFTDGRTFDINNALWEALGDLWLDRIADRQRQRFN